MNYLGEITLADIIDVYDVTHHPDYKAKKRTKEDILREMLDGFDVGGVKDGIVTRQEFENYYSTISCSIDNDTYYELMIRNAWHISGVEGQGANTANRRVLVTGKDGREYVQEIKNDLGIRAGDKADMIARLKTQGVDASNIALYGSGEDNQKLSNTFTNNPRTSNTTKVNTSGNKQMNNLKTSSEPTPGLKLIISKIKSEMKARGSGGFIGILNNLYFMIYIVLITF